jgi:hypothetical protein
MMPVKEISGNPGNYINYFPAIFDHESFRETVLLKTGRSAVES